ncbi:hypothetical protein C8R42DRAFT_729745 [Lentinula raphanica]|nr:hypothetical protein C8R42DRAFT_729745 [Lentinula raphanica]
MANTEFLWEGPTPHSKGELIFRAPGDVFKNPATLPLTPRSIPMSDATKNTSLEQLAVLTERVLHKQHLIQLDLSREAELSNGLLTTLSQFTKKRDPLIAYTPDLIAALNTTRDAVESSLERLQKLQDGVLSIRQDLFQIRLISVVNKLRMDSARDTAEDLIMAQAINKVTDVLLSYVETVDDGNSGSQEGPGCSKWLPSIAN